MALFAAGQRSFAEAVSELVYCNPFLPERIECERRALGEDFDPPACGTGTSAPESIGERPNHRTAACSAAEAGAGRGAAEADGKPARSDAEERGCTKTLCCYVLYHRYREAFEQMLDSPSTARRPSA